MEEGQIDSDIYTPETCALLMEAEMSPEDVRVVKTFTGGFQRRVLALTDEAERRRVNLISHVESDETNFIKFVSKKLLGLFGLADWQKKCKKLIRFFGKDMKKWSVLKNELKKVSPWTTSRSPLLLFLVEKNDLFHGENGRFEKLLEFMNYYNTGAGAEAAHDEFGRDFREMESFGMMDTYLDTCLKNKAEWESSKRTDRHYGSWAFQFAKLAKVFKGDRKVFDELSGMNLSVFGMSFREDFSKIYEEDMVKLRRVYAVLDAQNKSGLAHELVDLAISAARPGDVEEFEQAFASVRGALSNDFHFVSADIFRDDLPRLKAYCGLIKTLRCHSHHGFEAMSEEMLLKSTEFVKKDLTDYWFSASLVEIFSVLDPTVLNDDSMSLVSEVLRGLNRKNLNFDMAVFRLKALSVFYKNDVSKFKLLAETVGEKLGYVSNVFQIDDYKDLFGEDLDKLSEVLDCLNIVGVQGCNRLRDLADFYRGDFDKFKILVGTVGERLSRVPAEFELYLYKDLFGKDVDKLSEVLGCLDIVGGGGSKCLRGLADFYKGDFDKFKILVEAVGKKLRSVASGIDIANYTGLFGQDVNRLSAVLDELIVVDPENINDLKSLKDLHGNSMEKFKIVMIFLKKSPASDKVACARFIQEYERGGEVAAQVYLDEQVQKSKPLIGPAVPEDLRAAPEYMFYVKRVFPKGNYSDHDKNVACGDRLEHLSGYHYDRQGYPVEMTGLLGYRLKDGAEEDIDKLGSYQRRLEGIRNFVASRGPDNKALQKAFEEKVGIMFKAKAVAFAGLAELSVKEQMLSLFLTEVVRKAKEGSAYKPDAEVTDLIVEYKYAFQEDLEAYVARTADEAQKGRDEPSQHFVLWRELSTIYGENVKHILRHDLFGELSKGGGNTAALEACFSRAMPGGEDLKLKTKQIDTLAQTFDNVHILPDKKAAYQK